jgi:hypothetical protein
MRAAEVAFARCRLSASNVVELLIDTKGYTDLELPSNETIRKIINAEGYKLRKVRSFRRQLRMERPILWRPLKFNAPDRAGTRGLPCRFNAPDRAGTGELPRRGTARIHFGARS